MESVPNFTRDAVNAGYEPTTVPEILADHPPAANDIVHVEDGAWVNADGDFGSPDFINWNWPPCNASGQFDIANGWGDTPDHSTTTLQQPTEFNLDGGMYVTDDGLYIYFGFDADNDPWGDSKNVHIHIVIDVGSTADGGTFACWGADNVTYAFPYKPEWDIVAQWGDGAPPYNNDIQFTGLNQWIVGTQSWSQVAEVSPDGGGGGRFTEIALLKSLIGAPPQATVLNLSMWLRPAWDKNGGNCCLPADEDFPSDWAENAGTFNSQFAYTIQAALSDTDPPGILNVHQIDRTGVEIVFDEPMDQNTLNQSSNYTFTGWIFTGIRYVTSTTVGFSAAPPGFGAGSSYTITCNPGIHDIVGNSIDPGNNSRTWDGVGYADVTITAIDQSETHDQIFFKGSFNFYHEYDAFWSGGRYAMYDNGTNGDPVANDHRFTLVWPLVPHSPEDFAWGLEDENYNWLIVGDNQHFNLPDTTDIAVEYTIPDVTDQDVAVTIRCDAQFVHDPYQLFRVAGSINGWTGQDMVDTEPDQQWTITVTITAGSQRHQEFKFQRIDQGNTNWEGVGNRAFEVDDTQPTMDLGNMFFNNVLDAPSSLTAYWLGNGVELRWNDNYRRVNFEVWGSSNSEDVLGTGLLLGTVPAGPGNLFLDTNPGYKLFYVVRTVAP